MVRLAVALAVPGRGPTDVVQALRLLASPTRAEPGCLGCRVWTEDSDECTVRYVEEWASEDAMRVRRWDDAAKGAGQQTRPLAHYLEIAGRCTIG